MDEGTSNLDETDNASKKKKTTKQKQHETKGDKDYSHKQAEQHNWEQPRAELSTGHGWKSQGINSVKSRVKVEEIQEQARRSK